MRNKLNAKSFVVPSVALVLFVISAFADAPAPKVPRAVEPFPLSEVRLLDGPFRAAMLRNENYLLSLLRSTTRACSIRSRAVKIN